MPDDARKAAQALGHEIRVQLIHLLTDLQPRSTEEVEEALAIPYKTAKRHLNLLAELGVLDTSIRPGPSRTVAYRLRPNQWRNLLQALANFVS